MTFPIVLMFAQLVIVMTVSSFEWLPVVRVSLLSISVLVLGSW